MDRQEYKSVKRAQRILDKERDEMQAERERRGGRGGQGLNLNNILIPTS